MGAHLDAGWRGRCGCGHGHPHGEAGESASRGGGMANLGSREYFYFHVVRSVAVNDWLFAAGRARAREGVDDVH